ncbi:unnamed protein product [Clonostachys rhizophaga]|uniref:Uncharacterized protein n=1 Tax=Clonostachys rhizophaga TaxID=160324 RepID=A0A9N9VWB8_9HYPO|nr:unnamed protein product [Clonostachys rhizophaga]
MSIFQPPVEPLPSGIDLSGQTAIVTGASRGIGLEISKQLLDAGLSTLILAVRNTTGGETVKNQLLAARPKAKIDVVRLDAGEYPEVQKFIDQIRADYTEVNILMLNAGIGTLHKEVASTGHEKNFQVNFFSNVLLTFGLFPLLESSADKSGKPSRITWTGSRTFLNSSLVTGKVQLKSTESLSQYVDKNSLGPYDRYAYSKLAVVMFLDELAKRSPPDRVIVNNFCPGSIRTNMSDVLPFPLRVLMKAQLAIRGRPVEVSGWVALHAAVVTGKETHGKLLGDKEIVEPVAFLKSKEGLRIQKGVWDEALAEIGSLTTLPSWAKGN